MVELWTLFLPRLRARSTGAWLLESSQGEQCTVYANNGIITHAHSGDQQGFRALSLISGWNGIDYIRWINMKITKQNSLYIHSAGAKRIFRSLQNIQFDTATAIHHKVKVLHSGEVFTIHSPAVILGRDPFCDICLSYPSVSRIHVMLVFTQDACYLHDLASRNGTFLEGYRVDYHTLAESTYFYISDICCWMESEPHAEAPAEPDAGGFDRPEDFGVITKAIPIKQTTNLQIDPSMLAAISGGPPKPLATLK